MTEAEWLASQDIGAMLEATEPSQRQLRLIAAAAARLVWCFLQQEESRRAIELSERAADGGVGYRELDLASGAAESVFQRLLGVDEEGFLAMSASIASYASNPDLTKQSVGEDVLLLLEDVL